MTSAASQSLLEVFNIRRRFRRSVDLERDLGRRDALEGYILTPLARTTLDRILDGLRRNGNGRAWTLTGPYGAGKSAFALFLASILGRGASSETQAARAILKQCDREAEQRARSLLRNGPLGFCRIMIGGARAPLMSAICRASHSAILRHFGRSPTAKKLLRELADVERAVRTRNNAENAICSFFDRLARAVVNGGGLGVLMVVDELGKFLEYASDGSRQQSDVFILQRLAESAVRSGDSPFVLVTMLHQAFERYAASLPATARDEWAKIQGRFDDVAFLDSPAQLLALTAKAITRARPPNDDVYRRYNRVADEAVRLGLVDGPMQGVLREVLPIHPTAALLLPGVFRSALAQHERSLFTFLASNYEGGFAAFLEESAVSNNALPLYRLDRLYDFLTATLGPALYAHANGKRWAEIEHVLGRIPSSETPLVSRLVKCVGLLSLLGSRQVRASREVLVFALQDDTTSVADVAATLDRLLHMSLLVHRRHSDAFALWEGSDIDLDQCYRSARTKLTAGAELVAALEARASMRPWVARRHFVETGTLRYFEVRFALSSMLQELSKSTLGEADGRILYLLPANGEGHEDLLKQAKLATADSKTTAIAIPTNIAALTAAAAELRAWDEVRHTVPDLAGDPVARRELVARLEEAEVRLDKALQHAFGFGDMNISSASSWVHAGKAKDWNTARAVSQALSAICDDVYSSAPLIRNELLNRRVLSSAAAAARRTLLEAMLEKPNQDRLGFVGYPAEISMYTSLLERGGLHTKKGGEFSFGPPPPSDPLRLRPTWDYMEKFLEKTEGGRRSVQALQKELEAPPYGLKEGPFPVLLLSALINFGDEVALFEEGTFVAEVTGATIERLLRSPENFEIARFRISGAREHTLRRLGRLLPDIGDRARPLEVVRALCRRAAQLPAYTRSTKRIAEAPRAVRDAILQARDPLRLLFLELPQALGMEPISAGSTDATTPEEQFADALGTALVNISEAYPTLMREVERHLADALDLGRKSAALRAELAGRARHIDKVAFDPKLRSFILRAGDDTLTWDSWLESLATLLAGRPPAHWSDADLSRFETGLAEVARLFLRAEDIALENIAPSDDAIGIVELLRVSVATPTGAERRRLVRLRDGDKQKAVQAEAALEALLASLCDGRPDLQMAVVGRVLHRLIADAEHGTSSEMDQPTSVGGR